VLFVEIEYHELAAVAVKGKAAPRRSGAPLPHAAASVSTLGAGPAPFIGREDELALEAVRPTEPRRRYLHEAARAALAEVHGDLEAAAALYAAAAEGWKAYGRVPEQARALLGLGRCSGSEAALQQRPGPSRRSVPRRSSRKASSC